MRRKNLNRKKLLLKIVIIGLLLIIYTYVVYLQSIPDNIVIFEGETVKLRTILGLKADLTEKNQVIETLSRNQTNVINDVGKKTVKLSLFENIFFRNSLSNFHLN